MSNIGMKNSEPQNGGLLEALPLPKLEAYYDPAKNKYWSMDGKEEWIPRNKEDTVIKLEKLGYASKPSKGKKFSEAEYYLELVRDDANVSYAGPVAGNKPGIQQAGPTRYLVTTGPQLIVPVKGDWTNIARLGERLFTTMQFDYVKAWSHIALRGLYKDDMKHSQMLVFAGPPGCGKSFWQNQIITPMLGGRMAKPLQYMTGQTTFNDDIIRAEHLLLEDENSRIDIRSRREFGNSIKNFTVNQTQRVHAKGRDAFMVNSKHWLTLSVNDEPENLSILPPIDEGLKDKLIILKCFKAINAEWPTVPLYEFEYQIQSELPAYIFHLLEEYAVSDDMKDVRFGVKHFQHPDIVEGIEGLSPENDLEGLIDRSFAGLCKERGRTKVVAAELQDKLETDSELGHRARKLLYFPTACGVYLDRLHRKNPEKFIKPKPGDRPRYWTIDWASASID